MKHKFKTKGKLWRYSSDKASWFFVTINKKLSADIRQMCEKSNGWGQIRVEVEIGKTKWLTSLFPSKTKEYILAIKKSVRQAENIKEGDLVNVSFTNQ